MIHHFYFNGFVKVRSHDICNIFEAYNYKLPLTAFLIMLTQSLWFVAVKIIGISDEKNFTLETTWNFEITLEDEVEKYHDLIKWDL